MKKIFLLFILSLLVFISQAQSVQSTGGYNTSLSSGFTGVLPIVNGGTASTVATGTGSVVLATSPTITTPNIGEATATSLNKYTLLAPATSATITVAEGKELEAINTMTLAATDGGVYTFPASSGTVVTTAGTQTLTNKTLTTPTIADLTNAVHTHTSTATGGTLVMASISDLPTLSTGTYTPTLYNTTNVAASTAYAMNYRRVGSTVWVWGRVNIDITTTLASTVLGMTLPIASNFTDAYLDLSGMLNAYDTDQSCNFTVVADIGNDRVLIANTGQVPVSNISYSVSFVYTIK